MDETPVSGVIQALELSLDRQQGRALLGGQPIHLRPRTFLLLQYLAENRQRLVEKDELFAAIWKDTAVTDSTLVNCVQEIRKALNDDAKAPRYVRTVPKRGYQFIAPVAEAAVVEPLAEVAQPEAGSRRYAPWAVALAVTAAALFVAMRWRQPPEVPYWEALWVTMDEQHQTIRSTDGVLGKALEFNGITDMIRGEDFESRLPADGAPIAMTAWIRTTTTNGDTTVIFNIRSPPREENAAHSFQLRLLNDGRLAFGRHGRADLAFYKDLAVSRDRADDGRWHFVAGVFDGEPSNEGRLYVDGELHAKVKMIRLGPVTHEPAHWAIGNDVLPVTHFRGAIDDARVYARTLGPETIAALHRCALGTRDAGEYYFLAKYGPPPDDFPVFEIGPEITHFGKYTEGLHLAKRSANCALSSLRAADVGQDLSMDVELLVPTNAEHMETEAGPYFRCRRSAPGDGIIGGTSAGFWVRLHSTGAVSVRRLNPQAVVAFTGPRADFDASVFHRLSAAAKGTELRVTLDGAPVEFDQGGKRTRVVTLDAAWEKLEPKGTNAGTAGLWFSAERHNRLIGGQKARGFTVGPWRQLFE